jgi:hypothetical protein
MNRHDLTAYPLLRIGFHKNRTLGSSKPCILIERYAAGTPMALTNPSPSAIIMAHVQGHSSIDRALRIAPEVESLLLKSRGVAQLAEQRSPKAKVAGSIPATPAKTPERSCSGVLFFP